MFQSIEPENRDATAGLSTDDPVAIFSVAGLIVLVVVLIILITITARRSAQDEWNRSLQRKASAPPRRMYTQHYIDSLDFEPSGSPKTRYQPPIDRGQPSSGRPTSSVQSGRDDNGQTYQPYGAQNQIPTSTESKPLYRHPTLKFNKFRVRFAEYVAQPSPSPPPPRVESPAIQQGPYAANGQFSKEWPNYRSQVGEMWFDEV